jgi:hypothetical protein
LIDSVPSVPVRRLLSIAVHNITRRTQSGLTRIPPSPTDNSPNGTFVGGVFTLNGDAVAYISLIADTVRVPLELLAHRLLAPLKSSHARSAPPVRLLTSATILPASASISSSVIVFSRGCSVTAMATDFLSASIPLPS